MTLKRGMLSRMVPGIGGALLAGLLCASSLGTADAAQDGTPRQWPRRPVASTPIDGPRGLTRAILPPVTPAESEQAIRSRVMPAGLNPRGATDALGPVGLKAEPLAPPSIVEMARALRNDVDLIYEYVRNNVEYYPVWGVQKGALGALLDNQGTAFDQSALMVALLRQAGHAASFVKGRIGLTGAEVGAWLGVSVANACAVRDLLAAGRIPVSLTSTAGGCSALSTVQLDHLWVKVRIGATDHYFDPSYKPHTLKSGIDVASAAGYDATAYLATAKTGATQTADYIQGVNRTNIRANLETLGSTLVAHVRTNLPAGDLADLIGGKIITPLATSGLRQATLPYQNTSVAVTEFDDIPAGYKPTLRIQHGGIDSTFTSDAIYGLRLTITYDLLNHPVLSLDGTAAATGTSSFTAGTSNAMTFTISHPGYAPALPDQTFVQNVTAGGTYLVSNGWGPAGRGPIEFHRSRLETAKAAGSADGSELVLGSSLAVLSATWMAQMSRMSQVTDRLAATTTTIHHMVGIAAHDEAPYVDLPGNVVSITSQVADAAAEEAVLFSEGMHGSALESTAVQQGSGIGALSTVRLVDKAVGANLRIYDATLANYAGAVQPNLVACAPYQPGFQALVDSGRRLILPSNCDLNENNWTGAGYYILSSGPSSIGSAISGDLAGGFASMPDPVDAFVGSMVLFVGEQVQRPEYSGRAFGEPVDLASGHYLYDRIDIAAGAGAFPAALPFHRLYSSGTRTLAGPLGKGWSHNFAIRAAVASDGLQSMGEDSALDAAATVVEIMVSLDLLKDATKPLDKMVIATIGQRWYGEHLVDNTVVVRQGFKGEVFVKLPDGTYNPPPGNPSRLIKNPDATYTVETVNKALLSFNAAGRVANLVHPNGMQVSFTYSGNDLAQVQNSFGRTLAFTHAGGRITAISDGTRSVGYAYDGATGNLTQFTDALGNAATFQYDLPGRLTQIFFPANPGVAFIVNSYDSLGRVQTQANAHGKVWNYFFAGTRSEQAGPDGSSNVAYLDGLGNVVAAVDAVGRVTLRTYDAHGRPTKAVLPEGNSVEHDYDDVPCAVQKRCTHNVKAKRWVAKPGSGLATMSGSFTYEAAFNRLASLTDRRGKTSDFTYTAQGDPLQALGPPDAGGVRPQLTFSHTSFSPPGFPAFVLPTKTTTLIATGDSVDRTLSYDPANRYVLATLTEDAGPGRQNLTTTLTFDAVGNLTQVDGPRGDVIDVTRFAYDAERRLVQATDALNRQVRRAYDASGRMVSKASQIGGQWLVTCRAHSASDKLLSEWGPGITGSDTACPAAFAPVTVTAYEYDDLDRLLRATASLSPADGGNRVTEMTYGLDGRTQAVRRAVGSALAQAEATFTYTANGFPATITDAKGNRTTHAYDGHDRKVRTSFPGMATPGLSSATDFEQYAYDDMGNMTTLRRRDGQSIAFTFDNLNRLLARTYPAAADNVVFAYDLRGRLLSARFADNSHALAFVFDRAGRLTSTTSGGKTVGYQYDAAGNRTSVTWPEATPFFVTTDYDALDRPVAIKEMGTTPIATYAYDDLSRRTAIVLGNATSTAYGYDTQGSLATLAHDLAGSAQDLTLTYARNQMQEIKGITPGNALYEWNGAAGGSTTYVANGVNQYASVDGIGYGYDGNGNLGSTGVWSYTYDTDNKLRTANGAGIAATLGWDALGRLRQTTLAGATTQLLYDGARLVAEYDGAGTLLRRYVHGAGAGAGAGVGIDEPLARYEGAGVGNRHWYYPDHQGSVVATADAAGNATAANTYGPFGERGATAPGRFGYTGQQFIGGLDLYHYKARFYSPQLGRFLQTDPIGFGGGMNFYDYVGGSPVNARDPYGLRAFVTVSGNEVYIRVPINYVGDGANASFVEIQNAMIEINWSGDFGKYRVTTAVVPGYPGDSRTNDITVIRGTDRSYVDAVNGTTGTWWTNYGDSPMWVGTHEAGHLMGLDDRYHEQPGGIVTIEAGFEKNIMAAYGAKQIRERDIDDIIEASRYRNWNERINARFGVKDPIRDKP